MLDPGHLALTQIAQHLALLQNGSPPALCFPGAPQQIAALYEWFSARCRWKEKALTQRGLLVQAGDQSEQILPAGVLGRITPGRCLGAVLSFSKSCVGGIWRCLSSGKPASGGVVAG
ncbi:YjcZ-like family protein [Escherichia coli]|nr:YjcZ-like family protein [Escherichia coli]